MSRISTHSQLFRDVMVQSLLMGAHTVFSGPLCTLHWECPVMPGPVVNLSHARQRYPQADSINGAEGQEDGKGCLHNICRQLQLILPCYQSCWSVLPCLHPDRAKHKHRLLDLSRGALVAFVSAWLETEGVSQRSWCLAPGWLEEFLELQR